MKWLLLGFGVLVALIAIIAVIGAGLSRAHVASRAAKFRRPPADLYAAARDFAAQPAWRSGIRSVELLPPRDGRAHYRETSRHGAVAYVVLEDSPGKKLVTEIADRDLPFGGTWTFEFESLPGGGGRVRITERGEVKNVIFRFMARFIFGYTGTMEAYLRDLGRKFGEDVTPEP